MTKYEILQNEFKQLKTQFQLMTTKYTSLFNDHNKLIHQLKMKDDELLLKGNMDINKEQKMRDIIENLQRTIHDQQNDYSRRELELNELRNKVMHLESDAKIGNTINGQINTLNNQNENLRIENQKLAKEKQAYQLKVRQQNESLQKFSVEYQRVKLAFDVLKEQSSGTNSVQNAHHLNSTEKHSLNLNSQQTAVIASYQKENDNIKARYQQLAQECQNLKQEVEELQILNNDLNQENKVKTLKIGRLETRLNSMIEELKKYNSGAGSMSGGLGGVNGLNSRNFSATDEL